MTMSCRSLGWSSSASGCRSAASAKLVLAASPYAAGAAWYYIESGAIGLSEGRTWKSLASWCLVRDVQDEAISRGDARPIERRVRIEEDEEAERQPRPRLELVQPC